MCATESWLYIGISQGIKRPCHQNVKGHFRHLMVRRTDRDMRAFSTVALHCCKLVVIEETSTRFTDLNISSQL